ncbi:MAG: panC cmk [Chloroflexi bacterium]|nr:panC cmk [Chloroflexota bacterium]
MAELAGIKALNTQKNRLLIAIDGTAGAGKTTIGQMLSARLNLNYLDTGAMYRAVTLLALQKGVSLAPPDEAGLTELARTLNFVSRNATPEEAVDQRQYTVLVDGRDVSEDLRSPVVEKWVSVVAAVPRVRSELVERQREISLNAPGGIIMMGRDIGSVVLPGADLKIYLDASPEVRAKRRSKQSTDKTQEEARQNLEKRDRVDSQRAVAPLVVADGAVVIHTDHLTREQVMEQVEAVLAPLLVK